MKRQVFIFVFIGFLSWSCQNKGEADLSEPLSDELISINLSKNGKTDPELLIGEWDAIKFAYTADGTKFSHSKNISSDYVINMSDYFSYDDEHLGVVLFANCGYHYSRKGNLISVLESNCFAAIIPLTDDDSKIYGTLNNAYCFVIKDNDLIIHFIGAEKSNLLILKKR